MEKVEAVYKSGYFVGEVFFSDYREANAHAEKVNLASFISEKAKVTGEFAMNIAEAILGKYSMSEKYNYEEYSDVEKTVKGDE